MRARRLSRRLVGLPLFVALVLVTTPALAALTSRAATPSGGQTVSSGAWRLVFSTTAVPAAPSGTVPPVAENTVSYVYVANTGGTDIPASYPVTVTATSTDNAPMTLTACVGGTWTSASACSTGTTIVVGGTSGVTRWSAGAVWPAATGRFPAGQAVHVRVQNTAALSGIYGGRTDLTVSVAPR